jgi:large-conductance mechanosensitive channel
LTLIGTSFATTVDITANVYKDFTIFNYIFNFNQTDSIDKFSFEKPRDAQLNYIVDKYAQVQYTQAGDYYIIEPKETRNNTFIIKFKSNQISEELLKTDSIRTYFNFNIEIQELNFELILRDNFGEIINIYPQNYNIHPNNRITWQSTNVHEESLYIVNFKDASKASQEKPISYLLIISYIIPIIILGIGVFILFRKYKKLEKKSKYHKNNQEEIQPPKTNNIKTEEEKEESTKNIFEEIINKHLTENEKEVVMLVKEKEGISQYDILNFIPKLTKSNLSKIISKLHSKKILKRIKVGKVNHIYLGDKLNQGKQNQENKE